MGHLLATVGFLEQSLDHEHKTLQDQNEYYNAPNTSNMVAMLSNANFSMFESHLRQKTV